MTNWQQAIYDQIDFGSFYKDNRDGKVVCFRALSDGKPHISSEGYLIVPSNRVIDGEFNVFLCCTHVFKKPFDFNSEFTLVKKDGYREDLAK